MPGFDDLVAVIQENVPSADLALIERAYRFAAEAHEGLNRKSVSPTSFTRSPPPASWRRCSSTARRSPQGCSTMCRRTPRARWRRSSGSSGRRSRSLVDGVTKLGQMPLADAPMTARQHQARRRQAENLRKMFLAMVDDMRVVLIKLADRLHNMRTLDALPPHKQQRIARETMEIYAPLANRLGIWQIKSRAGRPRLPLPGAGELPRDRRAGSSRARRSRERATSSASTDELRDGARGAGHRGRDLRPAEAHLLASAKKMERKGVVVRPDLRRARRARHRRRDARLLRRARRRPRALAADPRRVRRLHRHAQGEHVPVAPHGGAGPTARPLEIQIRTCEMHRVAEYGIAAHWRYKEGRPQRRQRRGEGRLAAPADGVARRGRRRAGVRRDAQDATSSRSRSTSSRPKGEIIDLPAGATPIDFAYRIHTDVGHRCVGAKVNGTLVPLDTSCRTARSSRSSPAKTASGPSRDWLNPTLGYVKTAHAREKIRQWFRRQEREENIARGPGHAGEGAEAARPRTVSFDDVAQALPALRQARRLPGGHRLRRGDAAADRRQAARRDAGEPRCSPRRPAAAAPTAGVAACEVHGRRRPADQPGALLQARARRRDHRLHHARARASPSIAPTAPTSGTSRSRSG